MRVIQGTIITSTGLSTLRILNPGVLGYDETTGVIKFVDDVVNLATLKATHGFSQDDTRILKPSQFLIPGFVDTHTHAAQ